MKSIHDARAASAPSPSFAGAETAGGQNTHPGRAWLAVFVLLPLGVLAFVDRMSPSLLIDPIKASLGIDDRGMGLLQGAAFAVPFLLGSLPMGWIVDRCSNRLVIYFGVLFWSAATLLCGFASSFAMLLAGRCLVGLGEAAFQPAAWSMVARVFPPHRLSLALGVLSTCSQIGAAGAYLLGGLLIAQTNQAGGFALPGIGTFAPWQFVFLLTGAAGIFMAFSIFIAPREPAVRAGRGRSPGREAVRFIRENWRYLACHFGGFSLLNTLVYGSAAWVPTYLMREHGMAVGTVGAILAVQAVPLGMCGFIFGGWRVDRAFARGKRDAHFTHFACVGVMVAIVGGLGFSAGSAVWVTIACLAFIQFIQPFAGVSGAALQIATPVRHRGTIAALFIMVYNAVGMTLGPSFVIFLKDSVMKSESLAAPLALSYATLGCGVAVSLGLGRKYARHAVGRAVLVSADSNAASGP